MRKLFLMGCGSCATGNCIQDSTNGDGYNNTKTVHAKKNIQPRDVNLLGKNLLGKNHRALTGRGFSKLLPIFPPPCAYFRQRVFTWERYFRRPTVSQDRTRGNQLTQHK
jgi:hypothetical protein